MGIFCNRRPRGFHHTMIYSDERASRLKAMEERARRELGMTATGGGENTAAARDRLRGAFVTATDRRNRCDNAGLPALRMALPVVVMAAVLLLLYMLLAGDLFM